MAPPLRLVVYVQPRARRTAVVGAHLDGVKVQVTAPPVDGAANAVVIDLLARSLRVPKQTIRILRGSSGRRKVVEFAGADTDETRAKLAELRTCR